MLRSKKDVDRHVRDLLTKTKTEDERKVRGYNIARLYYNIGEFGSSVRYLAEFLTMRPRAGEAHRLLGQVHERLGNKEKAVQAYKTAYELGEGQKDLLLKICELYTEVEADSSVRLYWAEEGQRHYPHRESVVKLRESLLARDGTHSREELEKLYMEEIKASPMDVRLQTNLLRLYREWGTEDGSMLSEAYRYGCQVEARKAFSDSLQWYQTLLDVMQAYEETKDVSKDQEFHTNYLSALERLVYLTLASCSGSALLSQATLQDAVTLLHKFDQSLKLHLHVVGQKSTFGKLMVGQLYLHMAVFLIHNAKKEGLTQANTISGALLFHACRFRPPEKTRTHNARESFWYKLACHRMSQAAHVLGHMAGTGGERTAFLDRVKQQCSNKEAQLNIHQSVFGPSQPGTKKAGDGSFFLSDQEFISAPLQYPEAEQVKEWDHVVGIMCCANLGDLVWLCLQQTPDDLREPQPYYSFSLFEGLQFSSTSVNTSAPETLCHLDLLAFLAATVYCQRVAAKETHGPPPVTLPTVLSPTLCTLEQSECWAAAHTLFNNRAHHRLSKLRLTLQRGLEVIRAHGNHGIDLPLMAHLAQCFTKWVSVAEGDGSASSEVEALRERAEHYWQRVLLCLRATRNIMSVAPRNPLFVAPGMDLCKEEHSKVEEEGKFFIALRLVQAGKQQDAIQALGELKSPEAAFQRAMLYNEQAQAVVGEAGIEAATPETRAHQASLLTQARDTLYLTLDRLRMPGVDRFHPLNAKLSQQLEDVERRLSLLSSAGHVSHHHHHHHHLENDTESLSDSSHSPHDLTNGHDPTTSPHHVHSTPMARPFNASLSTPLKSVSRSLRQEARPSPERLHAQVQALSEVQETTLRNMEEQNTALKAQNEALRDLCTSMADGFRENSSLYRSMLEQNRAISQDAYNSVLGEVRQMHSTMKETQAQVRSMVADIADLRIMRAATATPPKLAEVTEVKQSDEVPVDIPAAVVPPALYGGYVGYYSQPSPLMPTPGLFGNPPFFPPSTVPDQTYSISSTVNQANITTLAQTTAGSLANPTPCSPATISVPSPSATSLGHSHSHATASWTVASSLANNNSRHQQECGDVAAPPHAFQITMPPSSNALTPPPRSTIPGELLSHSLPCSTTAGLLANVPPPLYSAVTPDSSPVRGQSNVRSLSSQLSTEGMSPAPNSLVAPSTMAGSQDTSSLTFPGGFRSPAVTLQETSVIPVKVKEAEDDNECYVEDDHDPCPDYKPVVPLPEKVEVRTGEEDEQILFEERARLFRFVEKEWRERGTGIMKLLHNPRQESARVLMRRDQTYKICANHLITSNIELQPMKANDKAWIWAARDYADEELRTEKFCCRFKTTELANNFRDAFLKAKAIAKAKEESPTPAQQPPVSMNTGSVTTSSLAMLFKPAAGSWTCNTCLITNKQEATECAACSSPNPNAITPAKADANNTASSPFASFKFSPSSIPAEGAATTASPAPSFGFKFMGTPSTAATTFAAALPITPASTSSALSSATTPTNFGFKFTMSDAATPNQTMSIAAPSTTTTTPAAPATPPTAANTSKDANKFSLSGFTFSTSPSLALDKKPEEPRDEKEFVFAKFSFGSSSTTSAPSSGFIFSSPSSSTAGSGNIFGGMTPSFGNLSSTTTTTTPAASPATSLFTNKAFEPQPSVGGAASPQKDDSDDRVEEYEPQVDFQPVVPMPDLVETKTGEEGEEVLFCERSKLFRFDTNTKEWKERGLGDLKILRNKVSRKIRVLMRRELVLKVCANHFITPDLKLAPMPSSDKAWIWATPDFADEEMRKERFAAKFKTEELALAFKDAFEKAQHMVESAPAEESVVPVPDTTTTTTTPSLAAMFPKAAGSWECDICLVRNNAVDSSCVSCSNPRPGQGSQKDAAVPKEQPKTTSSLASMFKPAAGSWECDQCLVRNEAKSQICAACGNFAPWAKDLECQAIDFSMGPSSTSAANTSSDTLGPGSFKFGVESKQAFSFGISQNQAAVSTVNTPAQPAFTFGLSTTEDTTSKPGTFSFGINTTIDTTGTPNPTKTTQPAFSFGSTTTPTNKPFAFTWQPPTSTGASVTFAPTQPVAIPSSQHVEATTPTCNTTPTKDKSGFVFGSPGKYEFSFAGVKAKSPRSRDISLCESEEGLVEEDEGDHLYFEPVVPLPDKVDVVTGEEEEEVLYSHRAKLFRLTQGEWKERGIGDIKVLSHPMSGKIRLLMRREQVHKICLNHYLVKDLEMRHKDDKTYYWAAMDHSEADTPKAETFAIRFKTPEIATEFFEAINDAKVRLGGTATELPKAESTSPEKTEKTPSTSATPTPTMAPQSNAPVLAQADSTTPTPKTELAMPTAGFFSNAAKSLFGGESGTSSATSLFSSTPTTTTTTTASLFGVTSDTTSFTSSSFGTGAVFGGPPAFSVNVSTNYSLRGSLPISIPTGSTTARFSLFGGATTTSSIPRSSFSFGDKFSSEPDTSDDVQVVYEKKATQEQVERARKLQLPDNFFLYHDAAPCQGCLGCEDDSSGEDEVVKITASTPVFGGSSLKPMFGSSTPTATTTTATAASTTLGKATDSPSIFGGSTTTTFGTTTTTTASSSFFGTKPSIFSSPGFFGGGTSPATTTQSIFGGSTTASIFGGSPSASSSSPGLVFGSTSTTTTTASFTPTMFSGASSSTPSTTTTTASFTPTMFSGASSSTPSTTSTPSLFTNFATSTSTPSGGMFSSGSSSNKVFGGTTTTSAPAPGFFTASLAAANAAAAAAGTTPSSLFASPLTGNQGISAGPFGTKGTIGAMLQSQSVVSTTTTTTTTTTTPSFGGGGTLFSTPKEDVSQVTFADLADCSGDTFNKKSLDAKAAAVWASRGQPVFGGKSSPKKGGEGEEDADESGEIHDPHFEPVVPLPDLVEIKTGEEELEVMFCNRAKLYRYDGPSKQWKERGVGDFKILHDPVTAKYRMLQRREQVHKLCCNHYLTTQLELHPLQSSETAWCWYAIDFSEKPDGVKEQLALKFKTVDLAREFKVKFEECQEQLRKNQAAADSSSTSTSAVVVLPLTTTTTQEHHEEEEDEEEEEYEEGDEEVEEEEEEDDEVDTEDEEDEDDDDDDDDDTSIMFSERCSLAKKEKDHWKLLDMGQLTMRYDDDMYGARITVTTDCGNTLAEHVVAIQTTMHQEGHSATWSVLNLKPEPRGHATFKATFSSQEAIDTFAKSFLEAKEYAENSNLAEEPGLALGQMAAADMYYGQGADKDSLANQGGAEGTWTYSLDQLTSCDPVLTHELMASVKEYFQSPPKPQSKD